MLELIPPCPSCLKTTEICVCASLPKLKSKLKVLILQHPQEPDKDLGTARIAHLSLPGSTLKIGLSWPNLAKALGEPVQAGRWGVLYLGSGIRKQGAVDPALLASQSTVVFVDKKGGPIPASALEGIVIIDGTWSQAKALWWRNAWLLKLKRLVLQPKRKSLYGNLRKEPRRECLSTIESIAEAFDALGEKPATGEGLRTAFSTLLEKVRTRPRPQRAPRPQAMPAKSSPKTQSNEA